ncbi:MAG: transglycosylase SLT domain-containing protein [Rhodobacter sp.]|nr:transglycosylase SLT domain-containing protein [Rhodobacter sp.]
MAKFFRILLALVLVTSCGSHSSTPRNLDDACSIVKQRPAYLRAFKRAERRWGVPVHVQMSTIYYESTFNAKARTPMRYRLGFIPAGRQSTAYGYAQALDGTWKEYKRETGRRFATRDNIRDATDFMGWYMNNTRRRTGVSLTDARNQYLAYHEGQAGYLRGSHRGKRWLIDKASRVQERSNTYQRQLSNCRAV